MPKIFYVYEIDDRNVPYISEIKLPNPWIREVRRYKKGRPTKAEAIFRTTGKRIPIEEVDDYISNKIYGTPKWEIYSKHRDEAGEEVHMVEFCPKLLYTLKIKTECAISAADIKLLPKICKYADTE